MAVRLSMVITMVALFAATVTKADTVVESTALRLYQTAKELESKGEYKNAIELLKQANKIMPNQYIQFHLAKDYFKAGDCNHAQEVVSKIDEKAFKKEERKAVHSSLVNILITCNINASFRKKGMPAVAAWMVAFNAAETDQQKAMVIQKVESNVKDKYIASWLVKKLIHHKKDQAKQFWTMVSTIIGQQKVAVIRLQHMLSVVRILLKKGRISLALNVLKQMKDEVNTSGKKETMPNGLSCGPNGTAVCMMYEGARRDYLAGHCGLASQEFGLVVRLYDDPKPKLYFALSLLCNNQPKTALSVLKKIGDLITPATPELVIDAVKEFKQKRPEHVKQVAVAVGQCLKNGDRRCERGLSKLIKQHRITACQVVNYFKDQKDIREYFAVDCMAEKAVSGRITTPGSSQGIAGTSSKLNAGKHQKSLRPYAWATAAVSGVMLITGAALLGVAESSLKDLSSNWGNKYQADAKAQQDSAYKKRHWGWAMVGIGAGVGIASAVLFVLEPKHVKVAPVVGGKGVSGVSLHVEF